MKARRCTSRDQTPWAILNQKSWLELATAALIAITSQGRLAQESMQNNRSRVKTKSLQSYLAFNPEVFCIDSWVILSWFLNYIALTPEPVCQDAWAVLASLLSCMLSSIILSWLLSYFVLTPELFCLALELVCFDSWVILVWFVSYFVWFLTYGLLSLFTLTPERFCLDSWSVILHWLLS